MRSHRKTQPREHARRVALYRRIDERLEPRERDDLVEPAADLVSLEAQDRAVEVDVLAPREILVKSGAHFDQCRESAVHLESGRWSGRMMPREQLEHRALAGAVVADDPKRLPASHLERRVLERPELALRKSAVWASANKPASESRDQIAQRIVHFAAAKLLGDMLDFEGGRSYGAAHTLSAK